MASDLTPETKELAWMERLSRESGRPVTFALLQNDFDPQQWKRLLEATERANANGAKLVGQVSARPTGLLLGFDGTVHPFKCHRAYKEVAHLPIAERVARLRDPEIRARLLAETDVRFDDPFTQFICTMWTKIFTLGDPLNYEPSRDQSLAALAERAGCRPEALALDALLERDGRGLLYLPLLNYADFDFAPIHTMLTHPDTVLSLSDGGAHCGVICDAGTPTLMLTHWVRGRTRGPRLSLEFAVRRQTSETAALYGLHDRGRLAPGLKADVNVIDLDALRLHQPEIVFDLPAGGRRLVQRADGYRQTVKDGQVTFEDGEPTGALPGKLLRGPQGTAA
jgi:N-acyl-D-aspartate/D-glutamate deacylase